MRPSTKPADDFSEEAFSGDYALLDSGNNNKLERLGRHTLIRPSPQVFWQPQSPASAWNEADAVFERNSSGGGAWQWHRQFARQFDVVFSRLSFRIKLTDFGHLGLFPEQAASWDWLRAQIRDRIRQSGGKNLHVLNLFAYTGGSSLAASQAGAHVVHVDAAKGVVDWARKNAQLCRLDGRPIRWLVDDALKFVRREGRRNSRYQGIILDPPTFGRGPKGEVFKLEDDILDLFEACQEILAPDALFVLYSCHTPGFTPLVLHNQLEELVRGRRGDVQSGEMVIPDSHGRLLPSGTYARWLADD